MLTETDIYLRLKLWLREHSWIILGGEPPGGTNDIPIIEIKDFQMTSKGSKGSRKIDLVALRDRHFMLIEVKRLYSYSDINKLDEIVAQRTRRIAFMNALRDKGILRFHGIPDMDEAEYRDSASKYIKAVGFNYTGRLAPADFVTFIPSPKGIEARIGARVSPVASELLTRIISEGSL